MLGAGTTNTGTYPEYGQAIAPSGTFAEVSAGALHTCALSALGSWQLTCWGADGSGQFIGNVPSVQVAAGLYHSCVLRPDGKVACSGDNSFGQAPYSLQAGYFMGQISAGDWHTCGVAAGSGTDGNVTCWGANTDGQASPPVGAFVQVSAGASHTCGVRTDGTIACWGANTEGQATPPAGNFRRRFVTAGRAHACALRNDGSVGCWGDSSVGQATPPADLFTQISAGDWHTCGVTQGEGMKMGHATCWGDNSVRQAPSSGPGGPTQYVSAGGLHTCAHRSNGNECWGAGITNTGVYPEYGQSVRALDALLVSAGALHTCHTLTWKFTCVGADNSGQSTPPAGYSRSEQLSAGVWHTCSLLIDGTVMCWGWNGYGQSTPPAGRFVQVSAALQHTCGVRDDGTVACWGDNSKGQVTPPAGTFTQVSTHENHTCGVRGDGTLVCWGDNPHGQVPASVNVEPSTLGPGVANTSYSTTISATGATGPPFTFEVVDGLLPAGLTFDPDTGVVAGMPQSAGVSSFRIRAVDPNAFVGDRDFTITVNNQAPVLSALEPRGAVPGGGAFTLVVRGAGFMDGATILWNGQPRTTLFVSATEVRADVQTADLTTAGTAQVAVQNPAPTVGPSLALGFSIVASVGRTGGDFDGDRRADVAVYRPSTGTWFWLTSSSVPAQLASLGWGVQTSGDLPVRGDFDHDGKLDPTVYRPSTGTWFVLKSSASYTAWTSFGWGQPTDQPVPGDYDGDGWTDGAVYRPSTGEWYVRPASEGPRWSVTFGGQAGDRPLPEDYDGDGRTDIAVYRPAYGTWFILKSSSGFKESFYRGWGVQAHGDVPVPGDYDGDAVTDLAVYRPGTGTWFVLESHAAFTTWSWTGWGNPTDVPMPADYDGDGRTDLAIYRPSTREWWVKPSNGSTAWTVVFGQNGDVPLQGLR